MCILFFCMCLLSQMECLWWHLIECLLSSVFRFLCSVEFHFPLQAFIITEDYLGRNNNLGDNAWFLVSWSPREEKRQLVGRCTTWETWERRRNFTEWRDVRFLTAECCVSGPSIPSSEGLVQRKRWGLSDWCNVKIRLRYEHVSGQNPFQPQSKESFQSIAGAPCVWQPSACTWEGSVENTYEKHMRQQPSIHTNTHTDTQVQNITNTKYQHHTIKPTDT